ncbi:MAG: UxaA family hydrolase [Alphaproteobacteria bacterium]|nr:UxaA family hydrolase [Alphaproteobacteria bacterium]MCA0448778.1 UxaA family hydrolase [Pseudomonadota bacterium]
MTIGWNAIAIEPVDGVAVALRDLAPGEDVIVRVGGKVETLTAREAVALGHKIARRAHAAGEPVMKYGARIALATKAFAAGDHVHVHNIKSARAYEGKA